MVIYEELTWPEVEGLSRDLLWVLPCGAYERARLEAEFPGAGVLPAVPYGFRGSEFELENAWPLLRTMLETLREDGFHRFVMVSPEPQGWMEERVLQVAAYPVGRRLSRGVSRGVSRELSRGLQGGLQRGLHRGLEENPSSPRGECDGKGECGPGEQPGAPEVTLIPIGHTEQHGPHLPLGTDTYIVDGLSKMLTGPIRRLPAWPYGVSTHRREVPGTLSTDPRIFEDFFVELVGKLTTPAYLLNGHGGNHSFLVNVVKFCGERYPARFTATSFLHTSSGAALEQLLQERTSTLMGHACELETSYMLALHPHLVHMDRAMDETDFKSTSNYFMDWVESGALIANPPWRQDTQTGTYGAPTQATAEKGRRWLQAAAAELSKHVREIQEQQVMRSQ